MQGQGKDMAKPCHACASLMPALHPAPAHIPFDAADCLLGWAVMPTCFGPTLCTFNFGHNDTQHVPNQLDALFPLLHGHHVLYSSGQSPGCTLHTCT